MKKAHLRRSLAALTTVLACLAATAHPAAAIPSTHDGALTSGQITFTKTGMTSEVIEVGGPSCTSGALQFNHTSNTSSSSVTVTAVNASHVKTYATGTYLTVITRSGVGNSPGHVTGSTESHTMTSMRVALVMTIYNTTSCTPSGTPICTLAFLLHMQGTSTSISTSSTFSVTGSGASTVAAFPACASGPTHLIGSTPTTTFPFVGHLVAVP